MRNGNDSNRSARFAALLIAPLVLASCASMGPNKEQSANIRKPQQLISLGKTSKAEVSEWMGLAAETYSDCGREIWVYSDKPKEFPFYISYIPGVGEIADAVEFMQDMRTRHELIIQFDEQGVVRKFKRRELE